jgi:tetratricopeptide (TPR) repeat protein
MTSLDEMLTNAQTGHEQNDLAGAEAAYRRIVAEHPDHTQAWTRLGDVLSDAGKRDEASACYRKVIDTAPDSPESADAYDGLAAILQDQGQLDEAITASRRAIELRGDADAAYVLGRQLEMMGRREAAMDAYSLATQLRPAFAEAHAKVGELWLRQGQHLLALDCFKKAVELQPTLAEAHCNLANALWKSGDHDAAFLSARRAVELKPDLAEAHNVLGAILKDRRRLSDALTEFARAAQLRPDYPEAINNAGSVLSELGRFVEAEPYFLRAVQLQPESVDFHENLACNLLVRGEYARGWVEYDKRRRHSSAAAENFGYPRWDGSDLNGKTILLHAEQGYGDTLQFSRYIPLVRDRGGHVIVGCPPAVGPVIARIDGVQSVITDAHLLPPFSVHCPLVTLPLVFQTTLETVPNRMPYITPDPVRVAEWSKKISGTNGNKRIGLGWAGNPRHKNDRNRSCPPSYLEPLSAVTGAAFFSLQKNPTTPAPMSLGLVDYTNDLHDFGETAALLSHLDLLITVDTALAHLAGAMGKPVWIMLPFVPDWRWLLDREDSPWYPSIRLFRQPAPADWPAVIGKIVDELSRL